MALSGSFSGNIRSGAYSVRVDWTASQNITNNTSTITCNMYFVNQYSIGIGSRSHSILIDGTSHTLTSGAINTVGEHYIGAVSQTVSHNSDGSKNIPMSFAFSVKATIGGTYYENISGSTTATLNTIPRASTASCESGNMGVSNNITISKASSGFTHTLKYVFNNATGTIVSKTTSTVVSWVPPVSLANQIPSALYGICMIQCETYNGNTLIGTTASLCFLNVPESVIPVINSFTVADNTDNYNNYGGYVYGKSKITYTINASGTYSSKISTLQCVDDVSGSSTNGKYTNSNGSDPYNVKVEDSVAIEKKGTATLTATAIDTRGRASASITKTITIIDYNSPLISGITAYRCTSSGIADESGAYVKVSVKASITAINNKNSKLFTLQYKKRSATTWTTATTWNSSYSIDTYSIVAVDVNSSYDIQLLAKDDFSTTIAGTAIGTSAVLMDFKADGKGVAIGKAAEIAGFECEFPATFNKALTAETIKTISGVDLNSKIEMLGLHVFPMSLASTASNQNGRGAAIACSFGESYPNIAYIALSYSHNWDWVDINLCNWSATQALLNYHNYYTSPISGNIVIHVFGTK